MIQNIRRRTSSSLDRLPGLPAEITVDGHAPLRGTLVDVRDGNVVINLSGATHAAVLAAAVTAKLTVHAPGLRFDAMTAPVGAAHDAEVELRVGPEFDVRTCIA